MILRVSSLRTILVLIFVPRQPFRIQSQSWKKETKIEKRKNMQVENEQENSGTAALCPVRRATCGKGNHKKYIIYQKQDYTEVYKIVKLYQSAFPRVTSRYCVRAHERRNFLYASDKFIEAEYVPAFVSNILIRFHLTKKNNQLHFQK